MSLYQPSLPEVRRPKLARLLKQGRLLRAIECHNPLSAMLGATAAGEHSGQLQRFDALWASGFSHAAALGVPDAELLWLERRLDAIADITSATSSPIIADADTGGDPLALVYLCRRLEAIGVSAVVVEDKTGAKRTSLADQAHHTLENPRTFAAKIAAAKAALLSGDLLIFARIESLIAGSGLDDALARAEIYLSSRADGVVIHSRDKTGEDIFAFMEEYRALQQRLGLAKPLVLIPTAYNHVTGAELHGRGAAVVIHANHMIRSAYQAMQRTAETILSHDRSLEADALCAPVSALFDAVGVDLTTATAPTQMKT
ncbi:MAG: isocitrate lyase/phosphoenolpyruvate mutase family protein [Steroidobacteraceae bacterium]